VMTGPTVNNTPLLAWPPTLTTTLPVVAPFGTATVMLVPLQQVLHGEAVVPLNVTMLVPWLPPKLPPVITTVVPTDPEVGEIEIMFGKTDGVTRKLKPLLATPATVTTTFPLVAPPGTAT